MAGVEVCRYMDAPSPLEDARLTVQKLGEYIDTHMGPNDKGLLALSGGVDSSVVAELCRRAVPGRVRMVHIDHGYLRTFDGVREYKLVCRRFSSYPGFEPVEAQDFFYRPTFGVEDAEEKRRRFRDAYSDTFSRLMKGLSCNVFLDGTIRPDIEEVDAGIKLQHNPGLEDRYGAGKVIEPLAGLVKADVRAVAKELGIPHLRPPFPGPGLMVRTPGAIDLKRLETERMADDIVETEFAKYFREKQGAEMVIGPNGEQTPFQYFAATFIRRKHRDEPTLLEAFAAGFIEASEIDFDDVYTLGTKVTGKTPGNKRVYADAICVDGRMGNKIKPEDWPAIADIAGRGVDDAIIARVLMDISPYSAQSGNYDVVIRAVDSTDARTAKVSDIEPEFLSQLSRHIQNACRNVGSIFFDITPKPPATIEYE